MLAPYQLVRVFAKPEIAQGNTAAIIFQKNNSKQLHQQAKESARLSQQNNIATTCFISQPDAHTGAVKHYDVNCFNGDTKIQCCGHGMIAAAKVIFENNHVANIIMNKDITATQGDDEAGNDIIMLTLPRLSARLQPVSDWLGQVITIGEENLRPNKAAVSSHSDGYLLVEFEPALAPDVFRTMQLDLKQICDNTKQAIVVVQFDQEKKQLLMRYFAPQYGVSEDAATGSVMRFVADYIEQRYQCRHFDVTQCSSQGGFMTIDCMTDYVRIAANASMELN